MKKFLFSALVLTGFSFAACNEKDGPYTGPEPGDIQMIVVSEGKYPDGDGALTTITYDGELTTDIFSKVNSRPIGNGAQDLFYHDGNYYVTLNNSKKIEVMDAQNFESVATIIYGDDVAAIPYYIQKLNDSELVISDVLPQLTVVDVLKNEIKEIIPLSIPLQKIKVLNGKLFGTAHEQWNPVETGKVYVFDTGNISEAGMRKIDVPGIVFPTAQILNDNQGRIWVASESEKSDRFYLNCIESASEKLLGSIEVVYATEGETDYRPGAVVGPTVWSDWGNSLYVDNEVTGRGMFIAVTVLDQNSQPQTGVVIFDMQQTKMMDGVYCLLPDNQYFYSLTVAPDGTFVAVTDGLTFDQNGYLRLYWPNGSRQIYRTGVGPNSVHFPAENY